MRARRQTARQANRRIPRQRSRASRQPEVQENNAFQVHFGLSVVLPILIIFSNHFYRESKF